MTRKLRRTPDFELALQIKHDRFIAPPRETQRHWLLNKAVAEMASDLDALNAVAQRFVPGSESVHIEERAQSVFSDDEIMEDWQAPLMRAMAEVVTAAHGDVLEIGFGRGVSAGYIQAGGVRSHTIVECNDSVIERFQHWRAQFPERDIRLIAGLWQDTVSQWDQYDGLFFHTFPLSEAEYIETVVNSVTFAEHFFPTAAAHLRPGGVFTYMTNEIDSFSRAHQRLVFRYFRSFELSRVALQVPPDVRDTWWADSMIVIKAVK
jgi:guanidinoacetate N-methyltransferase